MEAHWRRFALYCLCDKQRGRSSGTYMKNSVINSPSRLNITIDRTLLSCLAPEDPPDVNEMGGCIHCGGNDPDVMHTGPNFYRHRDDCTWVEVRKIICSSAGDTVDANGLVTVEEARNVLRHHGFNLVSKFCYSTGTDNLCGYLPEEPVDTKRSIDDRTSLSTHFICEDDDDALISLDSIKDWMQARLKGDENPAKIDAFVKET